MEYTLDYTNKEQLNLSYELVKGIEEMNYEYIYRGEFTNPIITNILQITSNQLDKSEDTYKIKSKIYFILVESLQNIAKHQDKLKDSGKYDSAIMIIQKRDKKYFLTTGNIIENENIDELKQKLEKINRMNDKELKLYYQEVLVTGSISEKGGAGLGLISIARKTQNKLSYEFQRINNEVSYFYLRAEIPLTKSTDNEQSKVSTWKYSFDKIKLIHSLLINEKILLNFSGSFDQDNLANLVPILDLQINKSIDVKKVIFSIMHDMLQNIVNFSEDLSNNERNIGSQKGIFLMSNKNNKFYFTSGNYIHNSAIEVLRSKLDFVNDSDEEKLIEFNKNLSEFFENKDIKKPDIAIINMRLLSKNKLAYKFTKVSELYSFFTLQIHLSH